MDTTPVFLTEPATKMAEIASILRENHMPQEMTNLILASRAGLPMKPVDPMSPAFAWVAEPEAQEQAEPAPDVTPEKPSLSTLARDIVGTLGNMPLVEGLDVLAMAANNFAGPHGYAARVVINGSVEVAGDRNG